MNAGPEEKATTTPKEDLTNMKTISILSQRIGVACCTALVMAAINAAGREEDSAQTAETNESSLLEAFVLRGRVLDATPDIADVDFKWLAQMQGERLEEQKSFAALSEDERQKQIQQWTEISATLPSEEKREKFEARVSGFDIYEKLFDPRPASNAIVVLRGNSIIDRATTDAEGKFYFVGLAEGVYELLAEAPARPPLKGNATGRIKWRFKPGCEEEVVLHIHAYPVNIKGRIARPDGTPVAGAKVTGGPGCAYPEFGGGDPYGLDKLREQAGRHEISTHSSLDGSYELEGFEPPHMMEIRSYLSGGRMGTFAYEAQIPISSFFAEVRVEAEGFVQPEVPLVPLVTEPLASAARRLGKMYCDARAMYLNNPEYKFVERGELPSSQGDTIPNIDIVLDPVVAAESASQENPPPPQPTATTQ